MNSGWRWSPFLIALLAVCFVATVGLMYRAEQAHLIEIRDECVVFATTDSDKRHCQTEYEMNSGWF